MGSVGRFGKGEGFIFLPQFPIFYRLFTDEVPEAQALTIGT